MQAGKLDQRVTLWRLSGGVDDWGAPLPDELVAVGAVWASVQPLKGALAKLTNAAAGN